MASQMILHSLQDSELPWTIFIFASAAITDSNKLEKICTLFFPEINSGIINLDTAYIYK